MADQNVWQCVFCMFFNEPSSKLCSLCHQERRIHYDWKCDFCGSLSGENKRFCQTCGQRKTVPVSEWSCHVCTLVNEPYMDTCSACDAKKAESANLVRDFESATFPRNYNFQRIGTNEIVTKNVMLTNKKLSIATRNGLTGNFIRFKCPLCHLDCSSSNGFVLNNCHHQFCRNCLIEFIYYCADTQIKCPFKNRSFVCPAYFTDEEMNALLNAQFIDDCVGEDVPCDKSLHVEPIDRHLTDLDVYSVTDRFEFMDLNGNKSSNYCLVKSLLKSRTTERKRVIDYQELVDLEKKELITNLEPFECSICFMEYGQGEGIVIRDCLHTFCRECLKQAVQHNTEAEMKCPFGDGNVHCESVLQDREIRALVDPEIFEKHLTRSINEAENKIANRFHCQTADCLWWCIYEEDVTEIYCPVCRKTNCVNCKVIHSGMNCKEYQEKIKREAECDVENSQTKNKLEEMVKKGEAMACPTCKIILTKMSGCDWLRCLMCKTEICWITRGPRWGPRGNGDITGGCRCRINGQMCHPRCGNCH